MLRTLTKCILVALLFILLAGITGCGNQEVVQDEPLVPVETVQAKKADLTHSLNTSGEIAADVEVAVAPKASGRVTAVRVRVGDRVGQGQTLIQLDDTDAQNGVAQAEAGLGIAGVNVEMAEQSLADAQLNYDRNKALFEAEAIAQSQLDQAESGLKNARAGLKLAQEQLNQAQTGLNNARQSVSSFTVVSPMAGLVAAVNVEIGAMAGPQAPVVTVVQLDTVRVKVNLSEKFIGSVKPGLEVPVTINSLNKQYTGIVATVGPKADPVTRAFPVEIKLDNQEGAIKSGMVADLLLSTGTSKDAVTVPVDAVIEREGQFTVFVVEDDQAKEVSVKVGVSAGQLTEIKEGIKEGQSVIVKGNRLVVDGQSVRVVDGPGGAAQ
ncbi:MAG: RND transporter [Peptococcaceae bacterium BRH_c8a]|nr:MAG: RND transporter [Peptococcaceae bacterium BRH_c8a]